MAIVTEQEIREFLGIESFSSVQKKQVEILINGVSAAVGRHCRHTLESAAGTEVYDGTGTPELILLRRPIVTLSTVTYTDPAGTVWPIMLTDIIIYENEGILRMKPTASWASIFLVGSHCWSITYTAGYTEETMPDDIRLAALIWIGILLQKVERKLLAVSSENIGDQSISYLNDDIPPNVKKILGLYRDSICA